MSEEVTSTETNDEILARLKVIFGQVIEDQEIQNLDLDEIDAQTNLLSLPLDSMALMQLMSRIEEAFTIYIPDEQAFQFKRVQEIADYVAEKQAAKAARKSSEES